MALRILIYLALFPAWAFGQMKTEQPFNRGSAPGAVVNAGMNNFASGVNSVVAGGSNNVVRGMESVIGGGKNNLIQTNKHSTIAGGHDIEIRGQSDADDGHVFVGGGENIYTTNAAWGTIGGGRSNVLTGFAFYSFIGGGWENWVTNNGAAHVTNNAIVGGWRNRIKGARQSAIGGGYSNRIESANAGVIGGGFNNQITNGNYHVIGGGSDNTISNASGNLGNYLGGGVGNALLGTSDYAYLGSGQGNLVTDSGYSAIICGLQNLVSGNSLNLIAMGWLNINQGITCTILNGQENWITTSGNLSTIIGGAYNKVTGERSGVWGHSNTNTANDEYHIGNSDSTETKITLKGFITMGASAEAPAAVTLTADNQVVNTTTNSYIRLQSDNATAANRTFVLTQGSFTGQKLDIEWVGTNAGELVDDSAQSGAGNHRTAGTWTPTQYDVVGLRFNGTDWVERHRSAN